MNTTQKFLLTAFVLFVAACSSVSSDRTNDATAISASASGSYSDEGLTSNNIINVRDQWPLSHNDLYNHIL